MTCAILETTTGPTKTRVGLVIYVFHFSLNCLIAIIYSIVQENIKKDYFWNTLGVFLQNAISPLLLIVITRVNGIYDSGLFSFAFSIAIILWVFGMWGGRTYQVSDVKREFSHRSYVMVRLLLASFMLIGAITFAVANHYDANKTGVIVALVVFKAVESIADAIYGVLQVHGRLYITGKSLLYKAIGGFLLFAVIDLLTHDILLSCLGIVAVNIILVVFYDLRIARQCDDVKIEFRHPHEAVEGAITIMKRTWPVSAVVFLSLFALNIPRYFVDLYHQGQIGYFGILAMPITLIGLLMTFVLQPKVVNLSKLYERGEYAAFNKTVSMIMTVTTLIGMIVLLGAYAVGVPLLEVVFGIDFSGYRAALMIIAAGGIINAMVSVFINIFIIIRRFKYQFYILLLTNIVLAAFSAVFVKTYGLQGAVALFTFVNIVQVTLLFVAYRLTLRQAMCTGG